MEAPKRRSRLTSLRFGAESLPAEPPPPKAEMTTAELASLLGVSPRTVNRRLAAGLYPFVRESKGQRVILRADVERWLRGEEGKAEEQTERSHQLAEGLRLWREANDLFVRALTQLIEAGAKGEWR